MNFLIDIQEVIKTKSKEVIFLKEDNQRTTNIGEAKLFNEAEVAEIQKTESFISLSKNNTKLLNIIDNKVPYNKYIRKYLT